MKKSFLITLISSLTLVCFGQDDLSTENFHSKKEVEEIVKEIRLIYESYESMNGEIDGTDIGYNMSICKSHIPIPGIGEKTESIITYFGADYPLKTIIDISSGYNDSHEELIYLEISHYTEYHGEFKYFTDDYIPDHELIFYYTTNANKIGGSSSLDPNEMPDAEPDYNNPRFHTIRAYFYKSKLIKVIVTNKETKKKNTHYHPFKELNQKYLKQLQNLE